MRHIFIGDIHGCYDEFQSLVGKLNITTEDRVYILGDMINRGPKSIDIIEFLYAHRENFFAIKGNHEVGFLKYFKGEKPEFENKEYIELKEFLIKNPKIFDFLESLPLYRDEKDFLVVHAGIIPGTPLFEQEEKVLTEIYFYKELPWYFSYPYNEKLLVYGHWSEDSLHMRINTIGLDTGCVVGRYLTAYILEDNKIIQEKAKQQYFFPKKVGYEAELSKKGIFY